MDKNKTELLRFTTAGSVDDGKSTLIGRLLYDSKSIFQDQLDAVERSSKSKGFDYIDLSLLTDGLKSEREHVTPYIRKNSSFYGGKLFKSDTYKHSKDYKDVRLTVDEENDFKVINLLINKIGIDKSWLDYTKLYLRDNTINSLNKNVIRNEGYLKSLKKD